LLLHAVELFLSAEVEEGITSSKKDDKNSDAGDNFLRKKVQAPKPYREL